MLLNSTFLDTRAPDPRKRPGVAFIITFIAYKYLHEALFTPCRFLLNARIQFSSVFQEFKVARRSHICWTKSGCTCAAGVRRPMKFTVTRQQLGEPCLKSWSACLNLGMPCQKRVLSKCGFTVAFWLKIGDFNFHLHRTSFHSQLLL